MNRLAVPFALVTFAVSALSASAQSDPPIHDDWATAPRAYVASPARDDWAYTPGFVATTPAHDDWAYTPGFVAINLHLSDGSRDA
jgi:hypothetical protein